MYHKSWIFFCEIHFLFSCWVSWWKMVWEPCLQEQIQIQNNSVQIKFWYQCSWQFLVLLKIYNVTTAHKSLRTETDIFMENMMIRRSSNANYNAHFILLYLPLATVLVSLAVKIQLNRMFYKYMYMLELKQNSTAIAPELFLSLSSITV